MAADVRSLYAQAVGHHQAGRLDEAVAAYRQLLALKPELAAAHYNLGNALWGQGRPEEAEASYRRALVLEPGLASAHNNLGLVLYEQGKLDDAVACYRKALALEPDYPEALSNLGAALCRRGALDEGEASIRRALAVKPGFAGALENLGALLKDQGRLADSATVYRQLLQIRPRDIDALNALARVLAVQGDAASALAIVLQSLRIKETAGTKRIFVNIVKQLRWTNDNREARSAMARALTEPWARPDELARASADLIKQDARIGAAVARAVEAWPRHLPASELFGPGGAKMLAEDSLFQALLVSAQNINVELERFLTVARRLLLEAAAADNDADNAGLEFYAALARQCFINEYVFFQGAEEIRQAAGLRDALAAALETGASISSLQLLAVAAYFPLHALCGAHRLLDRTWPEPVAAILVQQVREPEEEARLRAVMPRLTFIANSVSRLVQSQYEENPYPRWVKMPAIAKANTIGDYLRGKFPLAPFQRESGGAITEFLSAGCGTGQLALEIAQGVKARVLAIDLSLASLGYAGRKARELGLTDIEFAQADLLELGAMGRSFDVVECSGVLHHMADPFAGWRALLPLLRPGGFMLVGLYSEMARRGIAGARRFIAEKGYGASADDIRRCRQDLLDLDRNRELGTAFGDFFGVSSCRDLLFHVQEHRMRIPAIAAFLRENDLTLLGFETDNATLQTYRRRFPDDPAATNLDHWDAFENGKPDIFARMYVFWVQKKA